MRSTTRCRISSAASSACAGSDVLWQPGTDHAGIATQAVVERQLMERGEPTSREMGREAFVKRVWEWKAESGGIIIAQLKRLGASCDWSRERFTMDEGLSRAVLKVFVAALPRRPHLQGQAPGQLGPQAQDRHFRPRSAAGRGQGTALAHQIPDRGQRRIHRSSRRRGPRRCSATSPSPCIRTTSASST